MIRGKTFIYGWIVLGLVGVVAWNRNSYPQPIEEGTTLIVAIILWLFVLLLLADVFWEKTKKKNGAPRR